MERFTTVLTTSCSGGVISGNTFQEEGLEKSFDARIEAVTMALQNIRKPCFLGFGKEQKYEELTKASYDAMKALFSLRKRKGTDYAVKVFECNSHLADKVWNELTRCPQSVRGKYACFEEMKQLYFTWGVYGYGSAYDFFCKQTEWF